MVWRSVVKWQARTSVNEIYLLTTDRQTVIYFSTIHALELIYFDSNTQEMMKKQLCPSDSSNFLPLH